MLKVVCQPAERSLRWSLATYCTEMNRPAVSSRAYSSGADRVPDISEPGFLDRKISEIVTTCGIDGYVMLTGCKPVVPVHYFS